MKYIFEISKEKVTIMITYIYKAMLVNIITNKKLAENNEESHFLRLRTVTKSTWLVEILFHYNF